MLTSIILLSRGRQGVGERAGAGASGDHPLRAGAPPGEDGQSDQALAAAPAVLLQCARIGTGQSAYLYDCLSADDAR